MPVPVNWVRYIPRIVGSLIAVAAVIYLLAAVKEALLDQRSAIYQMIDSRFLSLAIGLYLLWGFTSHFCFYAHLRALGTRTSLLRSFSMIGLSSVGKYLPGNVGHYFGRFYLARRFELSKEHIGATILLEVIQAILAATFLAMPSIGLLVSLLHDRLPKFALVVVAIIAILCILVLTISKWTRARISFFRQKLLQAKLRWLGVAFVITVGVMLVNGLAFASLLAAQTPIDSFAEVTTIVSCNSVAWLVGFITPGAPGGIGIREAVLNISVGETLSLESVAIAVVASRVIAIIVEALMFMLSFLITVYYERKA